MAEGLVVMSRPNSSPSDSWLKRLKPDRGAQMANRRRIALAAVFGVSFLIPAATQAGSGGTPTAPGAGKSTDYCCTTWERVDTRRNGEDSQSKNTLSFLNGSGCQAIAEDDFSRNACPGTVVKCRGELFTPTTGKVERCLTP